MTLKDVINFMVDKQTDKLTPKERQELTKEFQKSRLSMDMDLNSGYGITKMGGLDNG